MAVVRLFSKKGLAITKETARAALNESYYNSDKIKRAISFEFTAIEDTVKACAAQHSRYLGQKKY
jgi:hypothetical protein